MKKENFSALKPPKNKVVKILFIEKFFSQLILGGDVILQKWHKFLAHLSKVAFGYKKKKKSCKNPVALALRLPWVGCHRRSAGKIQNIENFQNIVKCPSFERYFHSD